MTLPMIPPTKSAGPASSSCVSLTVMRGASFASSLWRPTDRVKPLGSGGCSQKYSPWMSVTFCPKKSLF